MCTTCAEEPRPVRVDRRRILSRLLPLIPGTAIVFLGLWTTLAVSRTQELKRSFHRQEAEDRYSSAAVAAFRRQLDSLAGIAKNSCLLYAASENVDAEEWATFLRINAVSQQPGLKSIQCLPTSQATSGVELSRRHQLAWHPSLDLFQWGEQTGGQGNPMRLRMGMPIYDKAAAQGISRTGNGAGVAGSSDSGGETDAGDRMDGGDLPPPWGYIVLEIDAGELLDRIRSTVIGSGDAALFWGYPATGRCLARTGNAPFFRGESSGATGNRRDSARTIGRPASSPCDRLLCRPVQWDESPLWLALAPPGDIGEDWAGIDPGIIWAIGGLATSAAVGLTLIGTRISSAVRRAQRVLAQTLAESRQQYHVLFQSSLEGLMVLDEQLRIHEINAAGARLLRADARQAAGRRLEELVSLDADALRRQVGRVVSWRVPECAEWRWTAGETEYEIEGSLAAVQIRGRWRCLTAFHNVTRQNAARRELEATAQSLQEANARLRAYSEAVERASRERIARVAGMWHEIRAPLSLIVGYARLLREGCARKAADRDAPDRSQGGCSGRHGESGDSAAHYEAVDAILNNGEHLLQVVNDILDFSKLEAGRVRLDIRPVSPRDVIAQVVSMFGIRARDKGIRLESEIAPNVPERILTDPLRLRQIIANLTDNAIKFTQQGFVRIEADFAADGNHAPKLCLRVRDTGVGMTEEQLGRLFQPFNQAEADTARKYGGTGLGLVICRRLGRLLGGDVWAESKPGQGTVFHVQVAGEIAKAESSAAEVDDRPNDAEQAADVEDGIAPHGEASAPVRVLLAEDSPENQRLIRRLLERGGASVTTVENGRRAVDAVVPSARGDAQAASDFDLVLMDVEMPEMDGPSAVRALRQAGCKLPIIALTAHSDPELLRGFVDAGYTGCLVKPVTSAELWREIRRRWPREADRPVGV